MSALDGIFRNTRWSIAGIPNINTPGRHHEHQSESSRPANRGGSGEHRRLCRRPERSTMGLANRAGWAEGGSHGPPCRVRVPARGRLARKLGGGESIVGLGWPDIAAINAKHALENAGVTKKEAVDLVRQTGRPPRRRSPRSPMRCWTTAARSHSTGIRRSPVSSGSRIIRCGIAGIMLRRSGRLGL